ncbi:MAG: molybdopterin-dependent oxidoreductase [Alphaproteobacteria bacterium]
MASEFFNPAPEHIDTSPKIDDSVEHTTCYMCAGKCGIKVHMLDGTVRHIEGNRDHPVNKGALCAKGAAGIMQHYSPAKLSRPLRRTGPRGTAEFEEIGWDEALATATKWLGDIRSDDPRKLAFFTGRDQSQALTGWWAQQFGTPNHASHGGMSAVNMAAAGMYSIGGGFGEFGEPDWELTEYFLMFGVSEDHGSIPIKAELAGLKERGVKFASVNPVRTGYSAIADEWIGIRPGTDGSFILALVHELLRADRIDLDYIVRYTNLPWLVIRDPGGAENGLFARGPDGEPLCWDGNTSQTANALLAGVAPRLAGEVALDDGRRAVPAFQLMAERYLDPAYAPDAAAPVTGISAYTIRRIAAELAHAAFEREVTLNVPWTDWAGRRHDTMTGRPVAIHAMRGIAAHSGGFETCRALHLLQVLLGSIDAPGGFRYRAPYPKTPPPAHLPAGPEDLLVDSEGTPQRIDKAFSWQAPLATQGMMHSVIANAAAGDPYPIDTLLLYMTNLAWNSAMDPDGTAEMLTATDSATGEYKIPHIICADAFFSETVAFADLVLPDTTWLERWDCMSLLDSSISTADGPADSVRQPVFAPDRDVRPFQDVLLDLGVRLGLPGMADDGGEAKYPGGYVDFIANHERAPGTGLLAGWRGAGGDIHGAGRPNPAQLDKYAANQGFWQHRLPAEQRYFRHANRDYLDYAATMGFIDEAKQIILQIYCEPLQKFRLAAQGFGPVQPPDGLRAGIEASFDPLPAWRAPAGEDGDYPLHAVTQRPMAMYQSWGAQNAWLRQIHGSNPLYVQRKTAEALDIEDGDPVWVISRHGRLRAAAKLMEGVNADTVWTWNAIGHRAGAWNLAPDSAEATGGFLLNHLISAQEPLSNCDPVTGQAAWYDLRVRIEKVTPENSGEPVPATEPLTPPPGLPERPAILRYGRHFSRAWRRQQKDGAP